MLVGVFLVIVQLHRWIVYSTSNDAMMPPTHCLYQLVSVSYHDVSCKCAFHPQIQQTSSSVNVERCYPEDGMLSSSLHFFCLELMWRILRSHPTSKFEPTSNNCYVFNAEEFPNLLTKMVLNSPNQRLWSLPASAKNRLKFNVVKMPQTSS